MTKQYGFYFDAEKCVQCHACEVACKASNNLEFGLKWRTVITAWRGDYPDITNRTLSFACMHCSEAPCEIACPTKAITKRDEDGITIVDQNRCIGCRCCLMACPFGIPQFGINGKMQKCHLCIERLEAGKEPACVSTCPSDALRFGNINELAGISFKKTAMKIASTILSIAVFIILFVQNNAL